MCFHLLDLHIMPSNKTLVIVTHPDIHKSIVNQRWLQELQKKPDLFTVHQLYAAYPDGKIDVAREQQLLLEHDTIILQFPLYWFSTPPLLKQWQDEVLTHGFAYGRGTEKLAGKRIGAAVTAGIKAADYEKDGPYHYTLEELLSPLRLTIEYINAQYLPAFACYGIESGISPEELNASSTSYLQYLRELAIENDSLTA